VLPSRSAPRSALHLHSLRVELAHPYLPFRAEREQRDAAQSTDRRAVIVAPITGVLYCRGPGAHTCRSGAPGATHLPTFCARVRCTVIRRRSADLARRTPLLADVMLATASAVNRALRSDDCDLAGQTRWRPAARTATVIGQHYYSYRAIGLGPASSACLRRRSCLSLAS